MISHTKVRKAVITVAGLGTRFLPVTKSVPKELIPVLGKPVIHYLVQEMAESGIEEVILVNSPYKKTINEYFKRDTKFEKEMKEKGKYAGIEELVELQKKVKISFVYQREALGNGHALMQARKLIGDEPFAMSDGDSIIDARVPAMKQVIDVYDRLGGSVIGVQKIKNKQEMTKYGNVYGEKLRNWIRHPEFISGSFGVKKETSMNGKMLKQVQHDIYRVEKIFEKPSIENVSPDGLIVGGMRYVFTPSIWKVLKNTKRGRAGEYWVADAADSLARQEPFYAYVYEGRYLDTGDPMSLLRTANYFANKKF